MTSCLKKKKRVHSSSLKCKELHFTEDMIALTQSLGRILIVPGSMSAQCSHTHTQVCDVHVSLYEMHTTEDHSPCQSSYERCMKAKTKTTTGPPRQRLKGPACEIWCHLEARKKTVTNVKKNKTKHTTPVFSCPMWCDAHGLHRSHSPPPHPQLEKLRRSVAAA